MWCECVLQTIITNVHHCSGRKVGDSHYSSASSQFTNSEKVLKSWQPLETTFQNNTDDRMMNVLAHSSGGSDSHTHPPVQKATYCPWQTIPQCREGTNKCQLADSTHSLQAVIKLLSCKRTHSGVHTCPGHTSTVQASLHLGHHSSLLQLSDSIREVTC